MPSIQPSADYTDRDLAALRMRLRALVKSVFPAWTDFATANFGNILLDLYGWSSDINGFYLDSNAAEAFLPTAVQRRSLLKLAALVGYTPKGGSAAQTVLTFTATGLAANCVIPAGTLVKTLDATTPIEFQTLSPTTLTVATPTATVTVENSKPAVEAFTSTGQPNLAIQFASTPYLDGSLVGSGGGSLITTQGTFSEVQSFVNSGPSDLVFVVKVDDNDRATIFFGDGVTAGVIPTGTITATFKTGGGAIGNAAAGSILQIEAPLFDIHGALVQITCTNALAATGGADREGVESIRVTAPESITAPTMSVARRDFEIHATQIGGIDRALYLTQNEDAAVPVNTGNLYLVSPGSPVPGYPTQILMDQVRRQFVSDETPPFPMVATQVLGIFPAPFIDIDIVAKVYLKRNAVAVAVSAAINAALAQLFATKVTNPDGSLSNNPLIDFGYYLRVLQSALAVAPVGLLAVSDVENAIRDVPGVREVGPGPADLTLAATRKVSGFSPIATQAAARQDVRIEQGDPVSNWPASVNFPRLGSVTLINGDTMATL